MGVTWMKRINALTSKLAIVGAVSLPSWDPGDPTNQSLDTIGDIAQCISQWHLKSVCFCVVLQLPNLQRTFHYSPFNLRRWCYETSTKTRTRCKVNDCADWNWHGSTIVHCLQPSLATIMCIPSQQSNWTGKCHYTSKRFHIFPMLPIGIQKPSSNPYRPLETACNKARVLCVCIEQFPAILICSHSMSFPGLKLTVWYRKSNLWVHDRTRPSCPTNTTKTILFHEIFHYMILTLLQKSYESVRINCCTPAVHGRANQWRIDATLCSEIQQTVVSHIGMVKARALLTEMKQLYRVSGRWKRHRRIFPVHLRCIPHLIKRIFVSR